LIGNHRRCDFKRMLMVCYGKVCRIMDGSPVCDINRFDQVIYSLSSQLTISIPHRKGRISTLMKLPFDNPQNILSFHPTFQFQQRFL
jgi:hypothetical protein